MNPCFQRLRAQRIPTNAAWWFFQPAQKQHPPLTHQSKWSLPSWRWLLQNPSKTGAVKRCHTPYQSKVERTTGQTFLLRTPSHSHETPMTTDGTISLGIRHFLTTCLRNELHVQGSVRKLPYVAAKAVPKVLFPDLDLTKEMKMITFKLADGPPLFFDQRLLIARSDYFKSMLIKEDWRETRTGEVDFTNNSDVTRESLQAILHYILTDSLDLQGSLEFYLTVRELADRFCLSGLVTIADAEMASLVNEGNVLQILGKTYDTNSCWAEIVLCCWTA